MSIPFVIVGMPRTGSSLLLLSLKEHPKILAFGELFHKLESERKTSHCVIYKNEKIPYPGGNVDAIEFLLNYVWNKENMEQYSAVGFKVFAERVECPGTKFLFRRLKEEIPNLHIIHIKRENLLDVFVSRKLAEIMKIWQIPRNSNINMPDIGKIYVEPNTLQMFFDSMMHVDNFYERFYSDCKYIRVNYDDLLYRYIETMKKCFEFLGVEPIELIPPLKKQNTKKP